LIFVENSVRPGSKLTKVDSAQSSPNMKIDPRNYDLSPLKLADHPPPPHQPVQHQQQPTNSSFDHNNTVDVVNDNGFGTFSGFETEEPITPRQATTIVYSEINADIEEKMAATVLSSRQIGESPNKRSTVKRIHINANTGVKSPFLNVQPTVNDGSGERGI